MNDADVRTGLRLLDKIDEKLGRLIRLLEQKVEVISVATNDAPGHLYDDTPELPWHDYDASLPSEIPPQRIVSMSAEAQGSGDSGIGRP